MAVNVAALVVTVVTAVVIPVHRPDVVLGLVIVGCAVLHLEATRSIERIRHRPAVGPHLNFDTTWIFAAVLLVHPVMVASVIAVVYLHRWTRIRRHIVHRQVFGAAAAMLSAYTAMAVLGAAGHFRDFANMERDVGGLLVAFASGAVFTLVDLAIVAGAIALMMPERARAIGPGWERAALELATVGLGILVAWALADWRAALAVVFGIGLVLHGKVLQPQLRTAASTDAKTGVLNHSGWISAARQAGAATGVLMIDLDHFKRINDGRGHLFGDEVLFRVAQAISAGLPRAALVGRFGGEEFVVLLPGAATGHAVAVAERIRRDIEALVITDGGTRVAVTVSVGVAVRPGHGSTLDEVVRAADDAMYAAKSAGRNTVRLSSEGSR